MPLSQLTNGPPGEICHERGGLVTWAQFIIVFVGGWAGYALVRMGRDDAKARRWPDQLDAEQIRAIAEAIEREGRGGDE